MGKKWLVQTCPSFSYFQYSSSNSELGLQMLIQLDSQSLQEDSTYSETLGLVLIKLQASLLPLQQYIFHCSRNT